MSVKEEFHPEAERRYWLAQRIGWGLMALTLVLAVLGLFGGGLFSKDTKSASADGIEVSLEYPRFARMTVPEQLVFVVNAPEAQGDLSILLPRSFLDEVKVHGVTPDADSTSTGPDGVTYAWPVEDWSRPVSVTITYSAADWRRVGGDVRVAAGELTREMEFQQFVFP